MSVTDVCTHFTKSGNPRTKFRILEIYKIMSNLSRGSFLPPCTYKQLLFLPTYQNAEITGMNIHVTCFNKMSLWHLDCGQVKKKTFITSLPIKKQAKLTCVPDVTQIYHKSCVCQYIQGEWKHIAFFPRSLKWTNMTATANISGVRFFEAIFVGNVWLHHRLNKKYA